MGDDVRSRLADISARLAATDTARAEQLTERDALIRRAREENVTWAEIQRLTGLTAQAVAKALRRT